VVYGAGILCGVGGAVGREGGVVLVFVGQGFLSLVVGVFFCIFVLKVVVYVVCV